MSTQVHYIEKINSEKTICGKDTIKVSNDSEGLSMGFCGVNCSECLRKIR